jgi:predicted nuclease of predicted toxin-antitoxin system
VKLLLDEMYSPRIAVRLRDRGRDAVSLRERRDLVALSDRELLTALAAENRTIVTNNIVDFVPIFRRALADGVQSPGFFLTSDSASPRSTAEIGRFVSVLETLVSESESAEGAPSQVA